MTGAAATASVKNDPTVTGVHPGGCWPPARARVTSAVTCVHPGVCWPPGRTHVASGVAATAGVTGPAPVGEDRTNPSNKEA